MAEGGMRRLARVVTVRGAGPGAGSTTMTMLLAAATSHAGLRTCIVGLGAAEDRAELEDAGRGRGAMLRIVESGTAASAASAVHLAVLRGCEVVLIDAGAGEEGRFAAAEAAGLTTNVVVVDEPSAARDGCAAALAALGRIETNEPKQPAVIVLNRAAGTAEAEPEPDGGTGGGAAGNGGANPAAVLAEAGWRVAWRKLPEAREHSGGAIAAGTPTVTTMELAGEVIGLHDSDLFERLSEHTALVCGTPGGKLRRAKKKPGPKPGRKAKNGRRKKSAAKAGGTQSAGAAQSAGATQGAGTPPEPAAEAV